ncbi:MAG: PEP-CTERM sorting domain-containing protein [Planctomycetota bacterium]|nr:MAG: PEP-CTERM sorting domain-containing protein [Planctomycetota bacterium]
MFDFGRTQSLFFNRLSERFLQRVTTTHVRRWHRNHHSVQTGHLTIEPIDRFWLNPVDSSSTLPEPSPFALLGIGIAVSAYRRRMAKSDLLAESVDGDQTFGFPLDGE